MLARPQPPVVAVGMRFLPICTRSINRTPQKGLQSPRIHRILPNRHVHQAHVLAAALLFPILPRWDVSGAPPRGDYRSVHNHHQRAENAASRTSPLRVATKQRIDESGRQSAQRRREGARDSTSATANLLMETVLSRCKHGCQFCSITSSGPPLLPPPPPAAVMCWPSSLRPRLFLSVHPADVFCLVCSDEALLLRGAGADPSCPLCLRTFPSGRICIT